MKTNKFIWPLLLCSALSLLCDSVTIAADLRIVPGKRIGNIEIGMRRDVVLKRLGKPSQTKREHQPSKLMLDYWDAKNDENYLLVIYENETVTQIEVTASKYTTADRLSTNTTFGHIGYKFKNQLRRITYSPSAEEDLSKVALVMYDQEKTGLAFRAPVMDYWGVGSHEKPETVIVHRAGQQAKLVWRIWGVVA